jgi:hypothetical protein
MGSTSLFGPNQGGKSYISLYVHRAERPHKHRWADEITPETEFAIFCMADAQDWKDDAGHYWAVLEAGRTVLGYRGEILSKFPRNSNNRDPWHGYPASPREEGDKDAPPDEFIEIWISNGVISRVIGRRIQRRKI